VVQRAALMRGRDLELPREGFGLDDPNIEFAKMAGRMGVGSSGPIAHLRELAAAIRRRIDVVKRGEPCFDGRGDAAAVAPT
jgi:hypothetical protein